MARSCRDLGDHPPGLAFAGTPRHRTELPRTLAEVDPHTAVDIEHEDAAYDRLEDLALAAEDLRAAAEEL